MVSPTQHTRQAPISTLQLVIVDGNIETGDLDIDRTDFLDLFNACEIEPYMLYMISLETSGYQHCRHISPDTHEPVDSFYLSSHSKTALWSHSASSRTTKAILIPRKSAIVNTKAGTLQDIIDIARGEQHLVGNAWLLPSILCTAMAIWLDRTVYREVKRIPFIESMTQHGQFGASESLPDFDKMVEVSKFVGFSLGALANASRQSELILELQGRLLETSGSGPADDGSRALGSVLSMMSDEAAPEDSKSLETPALAEHDAEKGHQISTRASKGPIFCSMQTPKPVPRGIPYPGTGTDMFVPQILNLISQRDTMASLDMALAAKADSNAMKTIAVMTMFFLPGTFFATLFALPTLHWTGKQVVSDRFWIYWAFTLPCTAFVILIYKKWQKFRSLARLHIARIKATKASMAEEQSL